VAIICAHSHAAEGWDRKDLNLPEAQSLAVQAKAHGAKKVIVLAIVPGAINTEDWLPHADAALVFFYPGQEFGTALVKLLQGTAAPGGRLPVSFPKTDEKRFTEEQYPGTQAWPKPSWGEDMHTKFTENTLVGYRWNDAKEQPSAFPFGYGLSYTNFKMDEFNVECTGNKATVSLRVANTGGHDGAAVPQLYVSFPSLAPVVRQLRGFQKVQVPKGGEADVTFLIGDDDWSFYDDSMLQKKWVSAMDNGEPVTVHVGSDSGNLHFSKQLDCSSPLNKLRQILKKEEA